MDKLKIYRKTKLSSNECLFIFKHSTNIFEDKNLWWLAWPSLIFNYNGYALDGGTHGVKDRQTNSWKGQVERGGNRHPKQIFAYFIFFLSANFGPDTEFLILVENEGENQENIP